MSKQLRLPRKPDTRKNLTQCSAYADLAYRTDIPVAGGAVKPLMRELISRTMCTAKAVSTARHYRNRRRTAKLYGGGADGENAARKCELVTIVSTGPQTNVALLLNSIRNCIAKSPVS